MGDDVDVGVEHGQGGGGARPVLLLRCADPEPKGEAESGELSSRLLLRGSRGAALRSFMLFSDRYICRVSRANRGLSSSPLHQNPWSVDPKSSCGITVPGIESLDGKRKKTKKDRQCFLCLSSARVSQMRSSSFLVCKKFKCFFLVFLVFLVFRSFQKHDVCLRNTGRRLSHRLRTPEQRCG